MAKKKTPKQLDREIGASLGENATRYFIAHPDEIAEVTIVFRGLGGYNTKRRYKKPVRVRNVADGDEFFVEESELFRNPAAAGIRSAELERKTKSHSTTKTGRSVPHDVVVGDEVYAVAGGRRHGPGIVEEIYSDGSMRVDFTRQLNGRKRIRPEDLIFVPD